MLTADISRCCAQLATGLLLVTGAAQLWHLIALQIIAGTATAFFSPTAAGLLPSTVPAADLRPANALLSLSSNITKVAAIGASGAIVAAMGPGWVMLVDAATFAVSSVVLATLGAGGTTRRRPPILAALAGGWRYVRSTPWLRSTVGYSMLLQLLVIGPHMVLGPIVAQRHLGGAAAWAAIGVAQTIGAIGGGLLALRTNPRHPLRAALLASLAMAPYLVALAIPAPLWVIATLAVATGVQGSYYMAMSQSVLQAVVPADLISRASSYTLLGSLIIPIGLAGAGAAADKWGAGTLLLLGGAWIALSTAAVLSIAAVRDLTMPPNEPTR
jgi:hypothetical protein